MRRSFDEILKEGAIVPLAEYKKLYNLFYGTDETCGVVDDIIENFEFCKIRGICLTLEEFDKVHGFRFEKNPQDFNNRAL